MLHADFEDRAGPFSMNIRLDLGHETGVLFGRSGAGKSLTLRALAGLRTPLAGEIILGGRVLYSSAKKINLPPRLRKVGLLFQSLALFSTMTAAENVAFALPEGKAGRRKAIEWLERMKLSGFEDRYPARLSGGQRQRVALARALASEPELLLLDEPFSALDGPLRRSLRRELRDLQMETDIPILYVTHQIEDLCSLGDRVIVLRDGQNTESFPVERLWQRGARGEAWSALGWGNLFRGRVHSSGERGRLFFEGGRVCLALDGSSCAMEKGLAFIPPDGIRILYPDLPVDPDLQENIFSAVVEDILPLGGSVRLYLASEEGVLWQAEHPASSYASIDLHPGSSVRFAIPPGKVETWCSPDCVPGGKKSAENADGKG